MVRPCGSRGHCLGLPSALAAGDALSLGRADQVFSPFVAMISLYAQRLGMSTKKSVSPALPQAIIFVSRKIAAWIGPSFRILTGTEKGGIGF